MTVNLLNTATILATRVSQVEDGGGHSGRFDRGRPWFVGYKKLEEIGNKNYQNLTKFGSLAAKRLVFWEKNFFLKNWPQGCVYWGQFRTPFSKK